MERTTRVFVAGSSTSFRCRLSQLAYVIDLVSSNPIVEMSDAPVSFEDSLTSERL